MTHEKRDIQRKLRLLQHAEKIGNIRKACRYFGVGRSSFYRWQDAYQKWGDYPVSRPGRTVLFTEPRGTGSSHRGLVSGRIRTRGIPGTSKPTWAQRLGHPCSDCRLRWPRLGYHLDGLIPQPDCTSAACCFLSSANSQCLVLGLTNIFLSDSPIRPHKR